MVKKALQLLKRTWTKPEGLTLDAAGPVSRSFGEDRGTPIDRFYIHRFLSSQQNLITGTVLEIADDKYCRRFGLNVSRYEVLHVNNDNPKATIVGDLTRPETLPAAVADCFVCTQTFNFIYNFAAAIEGACHLLKPGGVLLATVAGISQVSRYDMDRWGDYWRFTTLSTKQAFEAVFGSGQVTVEYHGNCLAAVSLLRGVAAEELTAEALAVKDPDYEVIITVLARKPQ